MVKYREPIESMIFTLCEKNVLTESVRSYVFQPEGEFVFAPGQFVQLHQIGAEQKLARAFSVASAPGEKKVTFLIKHNDGGHVSDFLERAQVGAQLEGGTALGRFLVHPDDSARVFIATGTGLAPIMSFIESGFLSGEVPTKMLFGVRDRAHLFWEKKMPRDARITFSRPDNSWKGLRGRVTEHVPALLSKMPNATWYICGNPEMVKEVRAQLLAAQIPPADIHFEIF